jgi:hypothetical protein
LNWGCFVEIDVDKSAYHHLSHIEIAVVIAVANIYVIDGKRSTTDSLQVGDIAATIFQMKSDSPHHQKCSIGSRL